MSLSSQIFLLGFFAWFFFLDFLNYNAFERLRVGNSLALSMEQAMDNLVVMSAQWAHNGQVRIALGIIIHDMPFAASPNGAVQSTCAPEDFTTAVHFGISALI
jgi:hypothetical protein